MASSSTSEAQMRNEIARLTASINQHKSGNVSTHPTYATTRSNTYVNPNYKLANKHIRPTVKVAPRPPPQTRPTLSATAEIKDVVLNGVAFESSGRSLVRKDLPKPLSSDSRPRPPHHQEFSRKSGHLIPLTRSYKPKPTRGRRPQNRNMTLNSGRRPYQARRASVKRLKYSDKPCPRFTTTGACSRGLTCFYQHDPSKIAICWNFLQGHCPNTADACNLSHDPIPERTPLCLHFLNKGRCTRDKCPFPHVNVGARQGVCRDFAVLGYCEKGLDCDKQHVRECPDFAEKGSCSTKGCKLPHVIRANRNRKPASTTTTTATGVTTQPGSGPTVTMNDDSISAGLEDGPASEQQQQDINADHARLGDEYISLTFNESESSEDESENDEEDSDVEEGSDPNNNYEEMESE